MLVRLRWESGTLGRVSFPRESLCVRAGAHVKVLAGRARLSDPQTASDRTRRSPSNQLQAYMQTRGIFLVFIGIFVAGMSVIGCVGTNRQTQRDRESSPPS